MNRIYKVIWSKVKHQYVVVSELAHSCTKSTTSRVGRNVAAVLAVIALTAGVGINVQAIETNIPVYGLADLVQNGNAHLTTEAVQTVLDGQSLNLSELTINNSSVLTEAAMDGYINYDQNSDSGYNMGSVTFKGDGGTQLHNVKAGEAETDAVNVKQMRDADAKVQKGVDENTARLNEYEAAGIVPGKIEALQGGTANNSIALGKDSLVTSDSAIAIGVGAQATNSNATAVGYISSATGGHSSAFGEQSHATKESATALGYNANAIAENAVAIGAGSVANEADTISVGRSDKDSPQYDFQRRITNVGEGINDYDAVNVKQMNRAVDGVVKYTYDEENQKYTTDLKLPGTLTVEGQTTINADATVRGVLTAADVQTADGANLDTVNDRTQHITHQEGNFLEDDYTAVEGTKFFDDGRIENASGTFAVAADGTVNNHLKVTDDVTIIGYKDGIGLDDTSVLTVTKDGTSIGYTDAASTVQNSVDVNKDGITMTSKDLAYATTTDSMTLNKEGLTVRDSDNGATVINGSSITTDSVTGLTNTTWNGKTDDESRAATEGQLTDLSEDLNESIGTATEGVVKWDQDANGTYREGYLTAEHQLTAGGGNLKVDEDGVHLKTADEYLGDSTEPSSYYLDMTNEKGITMGYTNGTSMNITQNSGVVISNASGDETRINGNNIDSGTNGILHTGKVIASGNMYVGTEKEGNAVVTKDQLTSSVGEATEGVVKWDQDVDGSYVDGSLRGMHFIGNGGIVSFGADNKVLINGTTGQILADSVGSNSVVTKTLSAGNGGVRVNENGKLTTTGDVLMENDGGESIAITDSGLNLMTVDADNGTGMVTVANGAVSMMGGGNTTVKVDGSGTTFGTLTGADTTTISGGSVTTNSVTGLANTTWSGTTDDRSRAATEGQLADLNATVSENAEGVVKWDKDANGDYQEGTIHGVTLQDGSITAANGNFSVDELGNVTATVADTNNSFSLTENGVSMKADNTTLDVTSGGVAIGNGADFTYINGNEINTGTVLAGEMYVGTKAEGNAVVTKDQLAGTVGEATEGVVKWDQDADGNYVDGSLRGMHFMGNKGIVSFGADDRVLINGTTGQVLADSVGANDVTTQSFTAGNGKVKVDENGKLSTTGEVSMMNGTGELVSLTDDTGLTMMTSGAYGTGMLTMDNGRINMRGGTTTTITIDNSGTTFTNLKDNTSTTIQGNTITTGTIHADGMTVGGKDVATVDDVTNATKDAVKYDEKGELHAGKDGTGSLALEKENGSASLISGNGKHSISVGNDGTTINGGLNVNGGLTVDGDTVATSGDVKEVKADVSGIKNQIGVNEDGSYKKIENGATDVISGINTNTDSINTIKGQIGGSGENGALKLSNGATTIESGINANTTMIQQNSQAIGQLGHKVGELDSRIDEVGAGAAALAALHPLDFDPDAKWDFAAGYGNYRGENAVAVGTFYRPNEDTMFSVGGTFGNDDNMINAGVSFKIGAGSSHVTTSRTAMAKEIKSMRDIVAKQDAQIQKLTAMVNALVGVQTETDTTTMFPDVPGNHWAYEAVAAMAKSGLVKGYPDGEFKGDRNMTRYEFAQIVYNAIQAGAEVDARLVEEFKPELEYFHIATVAKDKDGNPTIERVRAN